MHPKVLGPEAWKTVRTLRRTGLLDGWTLAGGTGLALQLGHRVSEDLDLFRPQAFESDQLLQHLASAGKVTVQDRGPSTLHVLFDDVRVSYLSTEAPLLFPGTAYRGLTLADPRDIAVMKLVAVGGRGSRKDFVDLHFFLKSGGDFASAFLWLEQRFERIDYNTYHILKSLTWFKDAESEPMPQMLKPVTWEDVKRSMVAEARRLSP